MSLLLLLDDPLDVLAVDERLKATHRGHLVEREHVLGLDGLRARVLIHLEDHHLTKGRRYGYGDGGRERTGMRGLQR